MILQQVSIKTIIFKKHYLSLYYKFTKEESIHNFWITPPLVEVKDIQDTNEEHEWRHLSKRSTKFKEMMTPNLDLTNSLLMRVRGLIRDNLRWKQQILGAPLEKMGLGGTSRQFKELMTPNLDLTNSLLMRGKGLTRDTLRKTQDLLGAPLELVGLRGTTPAPRLRPRPARPGRPRRPTRPGSPTSPPQAERPVLPPQGYQPPPIIYQPPPIITQEPPQV